MSITVNAVNGTPTATAQSVSTNEDAAKSITLAGSDPDGDSLTYALVSNPSHGSASLSGSTVTYTPAANYNGSDSFTFTVSDGTATSSAATVSITVAAVNDAPTLSSIGNKSVAEGSALSFSLSGSDPDGDGLSYSVSGNPSGSSLSGTSFNWTPDSNAAGTYNVTFTVNDGNGGSVSETITITVGNVVLNQNPILSSIGHQTPNAEGVFSLSLSASDGDGDALTYTVTGNPSGSTLSGSSFRWTPSRDQVGTYSVTFVVTDPSGASDSETVTITVSPSPASLSIGSLSLDFGTVVLGSSRTLELVLTNGGGATATSSTFVLWGSNYRLVTTDVTRAAVAGYSSSKVQLTYTPTASGSLVATLQIDFGATTYEVSLRGLGVEPVPDNRNPTLSAIESQVINEGSELALTLAATDADGDAVSYSMAGSPAGARLSGNVFKWTPEFTESGSYAVTFTVVDARGGSTSRTVTITVVNVNRPPVLAPLTSVQVTAGEEVRADVVASDPDGDVATVTVSGNPATARLLESRFSWSTKAADVGEYTFILTAIDPAGASDSIEWRVVVSPPAVGPPEIYIRNKTLDFDLAAIGRTSGPRKLRIENTGEDTLEIYDLSISRREYSVAQSDSLPFLVLGGTSRSLHVYFNPIAEGAVRADLTLFTNDPEDDEVIIRLRGEGEDAGSVALQVVTEKVVFSALDDEAIGRATLLVRNGGAFDGEVVIVSDDRGLTTPEDGYAVAAGRSVRIPLRFDANKASGYNGRLLVEATDGLGETIEVPWKARRTLSLVDAEPLPGAIDVSLTNDIVLYFSAALGPPNGPPDLDVRLRPRALSGPLVDDIRISSSRKIVTIPVQFARDTDYQLTVFHAHSVEGGQLSAMVRQSFSTRSRAVATGTITGTVRLTDGLVPVGSVYLANAANEVVAEAPIGLDGDYRLEEVQTATYRVYAKERSSDTSASFDLDGDGEPDLVRVRSNLTTRNIDVTLAASVATVVEEPAADVARTLSVDLDAAESDQALEELAVGSNATFTVAVYGYGVDELIGFTHKVAFDSTQLSLVQIDGARSSEDNILQAEGGTALFLRDTASDGVVEYGGAILAPDANTAVSGDGLLSVWMFRTREGFNRTASVSVSDLVWRTLKGTQRTSGVTTVSVVPTTASLFSPLLMDLDERSGNQGLKEKNVAPNSQTILELHYDGTTAIRGFGAKLEYDPGLIEVVLDEYNTDIGEGSAVLPLMRNLSNGVVELGAVLMDGSEVEQMRVATVSLRVLAELAKPTEVKLTEVTLNFSDLPDQRITTNEVIRLGPGASTVGDFDGNGSVDFLDFFMFADAFGNPDADPIYDLDGSGSVDFLDFFMFADTFGSDGRAKLFALAEEMIGLPRAVSLAQNYPNPFNSATTIDYALRSASGVLLQVYDLNGQQVRRLVDHYHDGGRYQISWDGLDEAGNPLSSGVYFMRLQALNRVETRKMMLMK